jgi:hypothetical protein
MDKLQIFIELSKTKSLKEFNTIHYKLKNKYPHKQNKFEIYKIALEVYCRKFLNYQVFRGSSNQIINQLKGIKASFNPKQPLKLI